jgi:hypothetical protein
MVASPGAATARRNQYLKEMDMLTDLETPVDPQPLSDDEIEDVAGGFVVEMTFAAGFAIGYLGGKAYESMTQRMCMK